ncbi:hypothetical protein DFH05DRAFT_1530459 [Lentinula detonsa]|uniref:DUF4100 domain-containing protein n=1 Tax=Lentinula detonsa TaxID=2804962 RepID=A0A9W8NR42_9AGAR|nr:hypothetical protein DFH05DRAFT_1530459 [Lentinula detonsa]
MSIYPPINALYNLRVPMPIPRTPSAPLFNGKYLDDFLEQIVLHANQAGETEKDRMVKYILSYSSDMVKDTIRFMEEFDPKKSDPSWTDARNALLSLYGSYDRPTDYTVEELKEFCRDQSAKSSFAKTSDIEVYYRDFIAIASSLKKKGAVTEKEVNYYFVLGLPHSMKEWFLAAVPSLKRTRDNPPTIQESLKILRSRYDKKSLLYEEWNIDLEEKAKPVFDEFGNKITTLRTQKNNELDEAAGYTTSGVGKPRSSNPPAFVTTANLDQLTKQMESLALAIQTMKESQINTLGDRRSNTNMSKTCFICGMPCGQDGVHPTGPRFCPETNKLIADHLMTFDAQRSRYTLPDGADLPRIPRGWTGGVSSYLRHIHSSRSTPNDRDQPPHMLRSTNSVELMFDNSEVLQGYDFALGSLPYDAFPTTRSGKDTSHRLDPRTQTNRPDKVQQARAPREQQPQTAIPSDPIAQPPQSQSPPFQPPQQQVRFAPQKPVQPIAPSWASFPTPPNPINREEGWKGSRPRNPHGVSNDKDTEMRDATAPKLNNPQYHFTSKVQDYANAENMLSHIGGMKVEVPLFQLLGLSPQLSKLMAENTRTKREYGAPKEGNTKSAEYSDSPEAITSIGATFGPESTERYAYVEPNEYLNNFIFRCSNAAAQIPTNRFFAMTVGDIKVNINGVEFTAMIDTGSELNVAGVHLPKAAGLPMDFDGMRWSLKGIHGDYERLRGCAVDAPIQIGGHNFDHHIFISQYPVGKHDIILGQPFLQEFSARIDYERGNHCKLYLWDDGNRHKRPTLMISITDPNNPRNATAIRGKGVPDSASNNKVYNNENEEDFYM